MQTTPTTLYNKSGVYALIDPRTKLVRYVGRSVNIGSRFVNHKTSKRGLPVNRWCQKLRAENLNPIIKVLEFNRNPEKVEAKWIEHYRAAGQADLNLHDGGKGVPMNGGGRCMGTWSVIGISCPLSVLFSMMRKYQRKPAGRRINKHWREQWNYANTDREKCLVQCLCMQVVISLGSEIDKAKVWDWWDACGKDILELHDGIIQDSI